MMKEIGLYFILSFIFFLIGQILWGISVLMVGPLFGNKVIEELVIGHSYSVCAIFGLIASIKLYKKSKR